MSMISTRHVWYDGAAPDTLPVSRVDGWIFDPHGRVLLHQTSEGVRLPGGRPELWEADLTQTLVRAAVEGSCVRIGAPVLLGYEQELSDLGVGAAQVRMAAALEHVDPLDDGATDVRAMRRVLVALPRAVKLLGWGESGVRQAVVACQAALAWDLPVYRPSAPDADID